MKRLLFVLVIASLAAGAFALDFGVGGGLSAASVCQKFSAEQYLVWDSYTDQFTTVPWGFAAFLDATYGQMSLGLRTHGNTHEKWTGVNGGFTLSDDVDDNYCTGYLSIGLLGKYPFHLGKLSVFPLLGIEYDLNLWAKDETGADRKASMTAQQIADLDQFWFKAGAGMDFSLAKNLSLRSELTLGIKLLNQTERDRIDGATSGGAMNVSQVDTSLDLGVFVQYTFASVGGKR